MGVGQKETIGTTKKATSGNKLTAANPLVSLVSEYTCTCNTKLTMTSACAAAQSVLGNGGCFSFPQLATELPVGPFLLFDNSTFQMPSILTSPCVDVSPAAAMKGFDCSEVGPPGDPEGPCNCTSFSEGQQDDCSAFAYVQLTSRT